MRGLLDSLTYDELERNNTLLLHTKPSGPLSIYDGNVGAVIRSGQSFITTPNADQIYEPALGGDRSLFLRADFRYGDDDPLLWPQLLPSGYHFLSAIPRIPNESHPLAVMDADLSRSDFNEVANNLLSGIGKICDAKYRKLASLAFDLIVRARAHLRDNNPTGETINFIKTYLEIMQHYLYRLNHLTTDFSNTRFTLRGLQRVYLYLLALLDWQEIHCPKLLATAYGQGGPLLDVVGLFTRVAVEGDQCYRLGVPVWLIRNTEELVNARIRHLSPLIAPSSHLTLCPSTYKHYSIFQGKSSDPKILDSIIRELRVHTAYPNLFGRDLASLNPNAPPVQPSSSSGKAATHKSKNRRIPYAGRKLGKPQPGTPGRDKYVEPTRGPTTIIPHPVAPWATALAAVQRSLPSYSSESDGIDLSYILPEPAGIDAVDKLVKRASMLKTWLRFRPALLYRLSNPTSDTTPMSARLWKDFLSLDYIEFNPGTQKDPSVSRMGRALALANDFYQSLLSEDGVHVSYAFNPSNESHPISWHGKAFDALVNADLQEILWEINEVSFRFEFMALDARLSSEYDNESHQDLIDACFPAAAGSLLVVDIKKANSGLASTLLDQRSNALLAVRQVMKRWSGQLPPLIACADTISWPSNVVNDLERQIACFYTQSFYNVFHRASIIPRRLDHLPQTIIPIKFHHNVANPRPNKYYDLSVLDREVKD